MIIPHDFKSLNNLQLARDYSECHKQLGERTLWIAEIEDKIRRLLSKLSSQANAGAILWADSSELQEQKEMLYMHKERAYEAILLIYQIEAEMARRSGEKQ